MKKNNDELSQLTIDELRIEAKKQGLIIGNVLSREQLIDLLSGEEEPEPDDDIQEQGVYLVSTVTLANLYAKQGFAEEAQELCQFILSREPQAQQAKNLLKHLGKGEKFRELLPSPGAQRFFGVLPQPEKSSIPSPVDVNFKEDFDSDELFCIFCLSSTSLYALWDVHEEVIERPQSLVLRLFSVWTDNGIPKTSKRDMCISGSRGEYTIQSCRAGSIHRVAIGWKEEDGTFFPIIHSHNIETPQSEKMVDYLPLWGKIPPLRQKEKDPRGVQQLWVRMG